MAGMDHWLGTQIRKKCLLSSLARQDHWLSSVDGQSHRLVSLLWCHCKLGCKVDHTNPWVFWLGFLGRWD